MLFYMRDLSVGDYVLIDEQNYYDLQSPQMLFINNNIAKIVNFEDKISVKIEYENIPDDIKNFFTFNKFKIFTTSKIKYHGKTKEDVESMIAAEKFNI